MKEGRKPEYPQKTPDDELANERKLLGCPLARGTPHAACNEHPMFGPRLHTSDTWPRERVLSATVGGTVR